MDLVFWLGHLKFWKKKALGIEFAKHFRAHVGPIEGLAVSINPSIVWKLIPCLNHSRRYFMSKILIKA